MLSFEHVVDLEHQDHQLPPLAPSVSSFSKYLHLRPARTFILSTATATSNRRTAPSGTVLSFTTASRTSSSSVTSSTRRHRPARRRETYQTVQTRNVQGEIRESCLYGTLLTVQYGTADPPDAERLCIQLRDALYPPSSSVKATRPNALQVVNATIPMMSNKYLEYVDDFIDDIAKVVGDRYSNTPLNQPELPGIQKALTEVMAFCFLRAIKRSLQYPDHEPQRGADGKIEKWFTQVLFHQAVQATGDPGRLRTLLDILERSLGQYQAIGGGFRVSAALIAAWIVLREKNGLHDYPKLRFVWPEEKSIIRRIYQALDNRGETSDRYHELVSIIISAPLEESKPETLESLDVQLAKLVSEGREKDLVDAWLRYRDQLAGENVSSEPGTIFDETIRRDVLGKFIYYLLAPKFKNRRSADVEQIERSVQEAVALVPRPIPREIHHILLASRARAYNTETEIESGSDVFSLDITARDQSPAMRTKREQALQNLRTTWEEATKQGTARDVRLYMLYMEGLGRLGDVAGLRSTWNELVDDQQCKQLYLEETSDPNATYPPTKALNHMLSALLLIPRQGAPIALELFEQATSLDSTVPCNLITINTVLRHYARAADVPAMDSLFALAEKFGFKPDIVTYTTLIQGLLRANELVMAKRTMDTMHAGGLVLGERLCSLLIADLAKEGDRRGLQHAEELLREMQKKGFRPGIATWTALISGYFRGRWEEDGWQAVDRMERLEKIKLNRTAYHVILREAGRGKSVQQDTVPVTLKLFKRMVGEGITPNHDTYVIVLEPLLHARCWAEAQMVLREMRNQGFQPEKGNLVNLVKRTRLHRAT